MKTRKISVALIGSSEKIYDFISALNLEPKKSIKRAERSWEEISAECISQTAKSWSCFTVKINDIEYAIQPHSNEYLKDYIKYFDNENSYAANNKQGFKNPNPFLWPSNKVIFCDVPVDDKKIAKEYCKKADINFINHTAHDPKLTLAIIGALPRTNLFANSNKSENGLHERNVTEPEHKQTNGLAL